MKRSPHLLIAAALVLSAVGCNKEPSTTSADAVNQPAATPANAPAAAPAPAPVVDKPKPEPKTTIPAGTKLQVTLLDAVSSDKSSAGDQFTASLAEPVVVGGKTVLAKG